MTIANSNAAKGPTLPSINPVLYAQYVMATARASPAATTSPLPPEPLNCFPSVTCARLMKKRK
ncbi:hypothetical protein KY347_03955 [Candidatus Woesearchaeota archaeon]|nr:hypothetical protein [Candidatus Woesearchaeota archaeon]